MKRNEKNIYAVLRRPRITEKAALVSTKSNTVVFDVRSKATKADIRIAIEKIFDVNVSKVRTVNYRGKLKRYVGRVGYKKAWKKAYVTLAEGSSIDVIEGL